MNNIKRLPPKQETVKMLLLRSGNQCYFPDCCHPIFNDKDDLIAECCHIEAAMHGGERFNPHQSEEDRRSIENLLFLCHEHHIETDNENIYTVEKLKEIKLNHENQFCEKPIHINPNYVQQVISKMQQLSHAIFETEETAKQILSILTPSSIFNIKELSHFFKYTEQIENYIPRKLLYDNRDDIIVYSYHAILTLSKKKPLRALIIADGGEGKTVYMSYLGNDSIKHNTFQFSSIDMVREYRLRDLVRDFQSFSEDEIQFIRNNSRIDFLLYNKMDKTPVLAIEVDGVSFHDNKLQQERDNKKDHILEIIGLPLLRLSTDGHNEEARIIEQLNAAMAIY